VGKLTKSGGGFKIDHPLAPTTMYLNHSFVESPDMKNVYDGIATLGPSGRATIQLPRWVEAVCGEFRYQLTAIGGPAPGLHIASEIRRGRFSVAGGLRGMKVSWQVTGIRHDPWAKANRIQVEEKKTGSERGTYRHPEALGRPEELSVQWARDPDLLRELLRRRKRGASLMQTFLDWTRAMTARNGAQAETLTKRGGARRKRRR